MPPLTRDAEPFPEEFEDLLESLRPLLRSGSINLAQVSATIAAVASTLGMTPRDLLPIYHLGGIGDVPDSESEGRRILLSIGDSMGMPLVYESPFPISLGQDGSAMAQAVDYPNSNMLGRMFCVARGGVVLCPIRFNSLSDVHEDYVSTIPRSVRESGTGTYLESHRLGRRYLGSVRVPGENEFNLWFDQTIPEGTLLNMEGYNPFEFFTLLGIREADIGRAEREGNICARNVVQVPMDPARTTPSAPASRTDVPAREDYPAAAPRRGTGRSARPSRSRLLNDAIPAAVPASRLIFQPTSPGNSIGRWVVDQETTSDPPQTPQAIPMPASSEVPVEQPDVD